MVSANTLPSTVASTSASTISFNLENVPEYSGNPYVEINSNIPSFSESDYTTKPFETYSKLDRLGRCGIAYANICKEIMPAEDEERESISNVKPSEWQTAKYSEIVDGNYLYNRCQLIGYQLSAENGSNLFYIESPLFSKEIFSLQVVFKWKLIPLRIMESEFALMHMFIMLNQKLK